MNSIEGIVVNILHEERMSWENLLFSPFHKKRKCAFNV